ncbi:MAG: hypothetical protein KKG73_09790 [Gammaproteobacteria bacterium]|nr:hypothetical protein [Gammaproteobacteria bacterium]
MCGVGGNTVAEAKQRITYLEFCRWVKYRQLRGSFNLGMRIERNAAMQMAMFANANSRSGRYTLFDFSPHLEETELTLEQAMEQWR